MKTSAAYIRLNQSPYRQFIMFLIKSSSGLAERVCGENYRSILRFFFLFHWFDRRNTRLLTHT